MVDQAQGTDVLLVFHVSSFLCNTKFSIENIDQFFLEMCFCKETKVKFKTVSLEEVQRRFLLSN